MIYISEAMKGINPLGTVKPLVVGATGQLGTAIVGELERREQPVRALVRWGSDSDHLDPAWVEMVPGDLRDAESIDRACKGGAAIPATAGAVFPRRGYSFAEDEGRGYANLLTAARRHGIERIVFVSVPIKQPYERGIPTFRMKRLIEAEIRDSGIPNTIFRSALFMDDYFALMGGARSHCAGRRPAACCGCSGLPQLRPGCRLDDRSGCRSRARGAEFPPRVHRYRRRGPLHGRGHGTV